MAKLLKISLIKSMIGRPEKHRKILRSMRLTKINRKVEFKDSPSVRGMIRKIFHLVALEEVQ